MIKFCVAFTDLLQVMYDASGVRLHAGRQAEVSYLTVILFYCLAINCFSQKRKKKNPVWRLRDMTKYYMFLSIIVTSIMLTAVAKSNCL